MVQELVQMNQKKIFVVSEQKLKSIQNIKLDEEVSRPVDWALFILL